MSHCWHCRYLPHHRCLWGSRRQAVAMALSPLFRASANASFELFNSCWSSFRFELMFVTCVKTLLDTDFKERFCSLFGPLTCHSKLLILSMSAWIWAREYFEEVRPTWYSLARFVRVRFLFVTSNCLQDGCYTYGPLPTINGYFTGYFNGIEHSINGIFMYLYLVFRAIGVLTVYSGRFQNFVRTKRQNHTTSTSAISNEMK